MFRRAAYTVCGKCKDPTKVRHVCASKDCDWFYCGRCAVMTERGTGRWMTWNGPRK